MLVMVDPGVRGRVPEGQKVAAGAKAWHLPVAPRDCADLVVLAASNPLYVNAPEPL